LDEATREKLVDSIHSSSGQSLKLVENLLLWARSSSGVMEALPSPVDLDAKVNESIEILRENLNAKHIKLVKNLSSGVSVWADPDMLHTVIRNLLSNAVKFTPEEGIIEVSTEKDIISNTARVIVRDTGVGMAPEVVDSLLDFETSRSTPGTNNESGTGLGLKLCKEFIDKNQGTLHIHSEENNGSEFKVTLPIKG
jgi:signal transduction histidine kinase